MSRDGFRTFLRLAEDDNNRLIVSLGGGSIPGLCGNLALLEILEDLDLRGRVDQVWGTSAGAVVGSGWASGATAQEVLTLVRSLNRRGVLDAHLFRFATRILASLPPLRRPLPDGIVAGKHFRNTIEKGLKCETFEECPIPFRCIACSDDGRATTKIFRRGKILPAVFCSMSLPGIMIPQPADDGRNYYDGGVVEKTPLPSILGEHSQSGDPRQLVVLSTHFAEEPREEPTKGFLNRFLDTLQAMEDKVWEYQLRDARQRESVRVMVLNPHLKDAAMFGFDETDRYFEESKQRFQELLGDARVAQTFGLM